MELNQKAVELKNKVVDSVEEWGTMLIDTYVSENQKLKPFSVYLKRGLHNSLARYDDKIQEMIDNTMLFIGDENGEYELGRVFDDALEMFNDMDEMDVALGPVDATIGRGAIRIHIPRNAFTAVIFGDTGAIKITGEDIKELRDLFVD